MNRMYQQRGKPNPSDIPSGTILRMSWRVRLTLTCLVGALYLTLAAAHTMLEASASDPSIPKPPQQTLTVQDRKKQWFFAQAVAKSLWELAMYAERLTLHSPADRVDLLHEVYTELIGIESALALKRQDIADQHGITETLMSHPVNALTAEQKRAFDAYMREVIALHQSAEIVVNKDAVLKRYYGHLLARNGMTVFLERLQDFLRAKQRQRQLGEQVHF
jgi:hypothetical protein